MKKLTPASFGVLLGCVAAMISGRAVASEADIVVDLGVGSCEFASAGPLTIDAALERIASRCTSDAGADGSHRWLVRRGLSLDTSDSGAKLHIKQSILHRLTAHAIYANGERVSLVHDKQTASANIELGGIVCLHLPTRTSPIVAVALEAEGVEDARGAFVRPSLSAGGGEGSHSGGSGILYGMFAGVVLATLAFNLVLYYWLGYSFLRFYCGMVGTTVIYGLAQSGALHWFGFHLPPAIGVLVGEFTMGIIVWFSVAFTLALFERDTVPVGLAKAGTWFAGATAVAGTATLVVGIAFPAAVHIPIQAINLMGACTLAMTLPICVVAALRGSRVVYLYVIAWTLPIAGGAARVLTGLGYIESTALIENSHFYAMCVEAIVSMFGIAYRIANLRQQRDRARARELELTLLADTDALTGLLNRRGFIRSVIDDTGMERALVLIDIDHFKTVNDGFGHETGDTVLRAVARLIEHIAPPDAIIGRLGGEEFAVMLSARDAATAHSLVSGFRRTPMPEGIRLTASAGVAIGLCGNEGEWRALYRRADATLYRAKAAGRDCLIIDTPAGAGQAAA